jgi:hypothetical protein
MFTFVRSSQAGIRADPNVRSRMTGSKADRTQVINKTTHFIAGGDKISDRGHIS